MALINAISQPARPINLPAAAAEADVLRTKIQAGRNSHLNLQQHRGQEEKRVRKMKELLLRKEVDISVSPYDTAWVSMVGNGTDPRYPQSLRWVMENQLSDGSWASHPSDPLLVKDSLSSTLASVLALRRWGVGDQLIHRGMDFIGANAWAANDKNQRTPIGFDITFAGMMESATSLGLNLPINPSSFQQMLRSRDLLVHSELGELAYAAEGLTMTKYSGGGQWKWEEMLRNHQRRNGSLFNSPSTTAAALLHLNDDKSLAYLDSILATYKNAPAAVYPLDIMSRLEMVDNLVKLGIHQYFEPEITFILEDIYKCWMERDEELFLDIGCLAKAFRLLRLNGYHVSSVEDYNRCQSIQRKELELLEKWVKDYRIEELKFARQKVVYGFFAAAAILFLPEHADARSSWAKNTVLVTLVDDLFDVGGSEEELLNFIELVKAWDGHKSVGFCSEQVEIVFKAVYDTTNEYVAKASLVQGRCVKDHFMEMWLVLVDCMWAEYVRGRDKIVPTMEEYIATGYVSVALGPVILVPMYFLGSQISEEAIKSKEYDDLFMHVSVVARLLNDLATIGREMEQGKENGLALVMMQENGKITEEEARRTIQRIIEKHRKELLRMVVLKQGEEEEVSIVPREVKEVFWQTSKIVHMFYMSKDGFSSPHEMMAAIDSVIYKPIVLPHQQL
ncbi:Ent-kaur-16-ene synthase, chloroplastic [Linum perenne]